MVRGNWQRRVEKAEARKAATKQRKQRRENRGHYKSQVHDLFKLLDRHNDALLSKVWNHSDDAGGGGGRRSSLDETTTSESLRVMAGLHVWIDAPPSNGGGGGGGDDGRRGGGGLQEEVDAMEPATTAASCGKGSGGKRGGRPRSSSNISDTDAAADTPVRGGRKGGRGRSNSNVSDGEALESWPSSRSLGSSNRKSGGRNRSNSNLSDGGKSKKKASHHPRSNAADEEDALATATDTFVPLLCRRHFFGGTCTAGSAAKGASSCPYNHYGRSDGPTMAHVLLPHNARRRRASRTRGELDAAADDGGAAENALLAASEAERDEGVADHELTEEDAPHAARMLYYLPIYAAPAHAKPCGPNRFDAAEEEDPQQLHGGFSIRRETEEAAAAEDALEEAAGTGPEGTEDGNKKDETVSISQTIAGTLARVDCSISNIAYVVLGGALIFDRYRGGPLVRPGEEDALVRGHGGDCVLRAGKPRSTSMEEKKQDAWIKLSLPCHILEYILLFLPDQAVAVFPLVCRAWYQEVGKSSPFLWRHLLLRRGWPLPDSCTNDDGSSSRSLSTKVTESALNFERFGVDPNDDDDEDDDSIEDNEDDEGEYDEDVGTKGKSQSLRDLYRESFVSHYGVLRDVVAVGCALRRRLHLVGRSGGGRKPESSWGTGRLSSLENEAAVLSFAGSGKVSAPARWGAGRDGATATCVALRLWSPTRVLAAYGGDCSLRLYEVARGSASRGNSGVGTGGNDKGDIGGGVGVGCRQTVCVRATPVSTSKRRHCLLVSMEVDDEYIVCLYDVYGISSNGAELDDEGTPAGGRNSTNTYLTAIRREDFLCSSGGGPIDLSESVKDRVVTKFDVREEAVQFLFSSSSDGALLRALTEMDNVNHRVHVSRDLSACGSGHFMLELSIQMDRSDADANNDAMARHVARKLCLFSIRDERIVWMQDLNDALVDINEHSVTRIASNRVQSLSSDGYVSGIPGVAMPSRSSTTTVALSASSFDGVFLVDVSRSGEVVRAQGCSVQDAEGGVAGAREERDSSECLRPVVVTKSHVIVGEMEESTSDEPAVPVIYFYELASMANGPSSSSAGMLSCTRHQLELEPTSFLLNMCTIGDDYLLALTCYTDDTTDEDEFDGHWFNEGSRPAELRALIVHIPTRVIIGRVVMVDNADLLLTLDVAHILPTSDGNTIALCLPSRGIVLTGSRVRDVGFAPTTADVSGGGGDLLSGTTKKKKSSQARKSTRRSKKDGFARGMSMRG